MSIFNKIENRVDAYKQNPQALQNQYAQSVQQGQPDIFDLIALNEIKSEMEAKKRQMLLKQAAQGKQPTVANQLAQQVMGMTKDDLMQQQVGKMKQMAQQQAQAQAASAQQASPEANTDVGIPSLPAPDMMPPQAMASGGIVAFDKGGSTSEKERQKLLTEIRTRYQPTPGEDNPQLQDLISRAGSMSTSQLRQVLSKMPPPKTPVSPPPPPPQQQIPMQAQQPIMQAPPQTGIASVLPPSFNDATTAAVQKAMTADPTVLATSEQALANAAYARAPEEVDLEKKQIAALMAADQAARNPERRKSEALTRMLLGAAGRSGLGSMAQGAGYAGLNYMAEEEAKDIQRMKELQERQMSPFKTDRDIRGKAFGAREKPLESAMAMQRQGIASAASMTTSALDRQNNALIHQLDRDSQARIHQMDRESSERIAKAQIAVQAESNRIANAARRDQFVETMRERTKKDTNAPYYKQLENYIAQQATGVELKPAQLTEMKILQNTIASNIEEIDKRFDTMAANSGGFKVDSKKFKVTEVPKK